MPTIVEIPKTEEQIRSIWGMGFKPTEQEPKYCDRNICFRNEYNGIGCDECEITKSQEPQESEEV